MTNPERYWIRIKGTEEDEFYAIRSKSRKRLIITVMKGGTAAEVELTPDQVAAVGRYFVESVSQGAGDR